MYEVLSAPLPDQDGTVNKVIEIVRDITEFVQAAENIRQVTEGTRAILWRGKVTQLKDKAKTSRDFNWDVNYINLENISKILSLPEHPGKDLGETFHQSIIGDDLVEMEETCTQALINNAKSYKQDFRLKDSNDVLHWMHEDVAINRIDDTHFELIGIILDITERKQIEVEKRSLETQLLQAQKMEAIGNLAGGVAHDFNNLLTIIQGNTQLLMMKIDENDPNRRELKQIINATTRAANLTRQLLLFSRKQAMEFKTININNTISDLLKMIKRLIGENINILPKLDQQLWNIEADEGNLEQIIVNLAVNARDAMPTGGTLTIQTKNMPLTEEESQCIKYARAGRFIRLSIADTGKGIPKDLQDKIFDPFFTTKEAGKGTGLGLSVVYGIIKKHNGWINVSSTVNRGTIFNIWLPVSENAMIAETSQKAHKSLPQGNNEKVLIIEDETELLMLVSTALQQNGYLPINARNSTEALEQIKKENGAIDLIISDVILPDKDGVQLVKEILSEYPDIPVILSSGYSEERIVQSIIENKNSRFIQKPFTIPELLDLMHNILVETEKGQ